MLKNIRLRSSGSYHRDNSRLATNNCEISHHDNSCEGCASNEVNPLTCRPYQHAANHLATTEAPCRKCGRESDPHRNPLRGDVRPFKTRCHGNNGPKISRFVLTSLFLLTLTFSFLSTSAHQTPKEPSSPNSLYDITVDTHVTAKLPGNEIYDPLMSRIVKKRSSKRRSPQKVIRRKGKKNKKRKRVSRVDESLCHGNGSSGGWKTPQGVNRLYNHMGQSYNLAVYRDGTVAGERSGCRSDYSEFLFYFINKFFITLNQIKNYFNLLLEKICNLNVKFTDRFQ